MYTDLWDLYTLFCKFADGETRSRLPSILYFNQNIFIVIYIHTYTTVCD